VYGVIHIRTAATKHSALRTHDPVGVLELTREGTSGRWKKDGTASDPQYRIRARMATHFGSHGSVLIIESTKIGAQRTAQAIADEIDDDHLEAAPLVALVIKRLGEAHPLIAPLRRG